MRFRRSPLYFAAVFLLLALAACSDRPPNVESVDHGEATRTPASDRNTPTATDDDRSATPGETPSGGDDRTPGPDLDLPDDLLQALEEVADVRELDLPDTLEVEFITRRELPAAYDSITTDEDRELIAQRTVLYRLLGYIENDEDYGTIMDRFISLGVAGFYVPSEKKLWVVTNDGSETEFGDMPAVQQATLAHEFVHSLQDAAFDLDAVIEALPEGPDPQLAAITIIEGDAETFSAQWADDYLARVGTNLVAFRFDRPLDQLGIPEPILREEFFPYLEGPALVEGIVEEGGVERINELVQNPPVATAQLLHPDLLDDPEWGPVSVELPDLADVLGDDWERSSGGTFGEFGLSNYLQQFVSERDAADAARGWAGDAFEAWSDGDDSVAAFRIEFEDDDDASEFAGTHEAEFVDDLDETDDGYSIVELEDGDVLALAEADGRTVTFVLASDRAVAEDVMQEMLGDSSR